MNNKTRFVVITLIFAFMGIHLIALSFILIAGYLFESTITKTLGIGIIWGFFILYFKAIPYKPNKTMWNIILFLLIAFTIFSYLYPFQNGHFD